MNLQDFYDHTYTISTDGNIADPLNDYLIDCTKKLQQMCESLYKLESERLVLENSVKRFRKLVHVNRPEPGKLSNLHLSPK